MHLLQEIVMGTIYLADLLRNEKHRERHFKQCFQNKEYLQERFGRQYTYDASHKT